MLLAVDSHLKLTISCVSSEHLIRVMLWFWVTSRRLQSRGLESLTAGLQSLRLASRLKPWLRTIDGLGWLMAASHGLRVQTRKLTAAN